MYIYVYIYTCIYIPHSRALTSGASALKSLNLYQVLFITMKFDKERLFLGRKNVSAKCVYIYICTRFRLHERKRKNTKTNFSATVRNLIDCYISALLAPPMLNSPQDNQTNYIYNTSLEVSLMVWFYSAKKFQPTRVSQIIVYIYTYL